MTEKKNNPSKKQNKLTGESKMVDDLLKATKGHGEGTGVYSVTTTEYKHINPSKIENKTETPTEKRSVGKPPKYSSVQDLEARINDYFNGGCKTKTIYIKTGKDEYTPVEQPIPTISGLALYLGFVNRASMYDYQDKPEFTNTIKKARAFMEQEYEEQLRFNPTGAIFALKNFGRTDKQTMEIGGHNGAPIEMIDLSNKTNKEIEAIRKQYL